MSLVSKFRELCSKYGGITEVTGEKVVCVKGGKKLFEGMIHGGKLFINTTPHPINFSDGTSLSGSSLSGSVFLAQKLKARPVERVLFTSNGVKFVETAFEGKKSRDN